METLPFVVATLLLCNAGLVNAGFCGYADAIEHGSHTGGENRKIPAWETVYYECDPGYNLLGPNEKTCEQYFFPPSISWDTDEVPRCVKSVYILDYSGFAFGSGSGYGSGSDYGSGYDTELFCGYADAIEHGSHTGGENRKIPEWETVYYECDPGYHLVGPRRRTCFFSVWDTHEVPRCVDIESEDFECLVMGGTCQDYRYYFCTAGYKTGICGGDDNRRCCLKCDLTCMIDEDIDSQRDGKCTQEKGRCFHNTNYCRYHSRKGKCGGSNRKCCVGNAPTALLVFDVFLNFIRGIFT